MTAAIVSGRRKVAPFGLAGGAPGASGRNYVERRDGTVIELGGVARVAMDAGDVFVVETPGGGGYGAPPEADDAARSDARQPAADPGGAGAPRR
jgi:5-oxoprolinase (ATP-hydrolysing)